MKLQFLHALLVPGSDLRRTHSVLVRALPFAAVASNDSLFERPRLRCRWLHNPESGRLEMRWSTHV